MSGILMILGAVAIIAVMVLLYRKVLPRKLDGSFTSKYAQMLHDYFNFKKLYIESVLKFLFVLATVTCVVMGLIGLLQALFDLLSGFVDMFAYYGMDYFPYLLGEFVLSVLGSVFLVAFGPVLLRLIYEGTMMLILMVKNVIEINEKIPAPVRETTAEQPEAAAADENVEE